jgi:hypothetical protein
MVTAEQTQELEMSEDMQSYMREKEARLEALQTLAEKIATEEVKKGLELAISIQRVQELLKCLSKENQEAANKQYELMSEKREGKAFTFMGHKIGKQSGRVKWIVTGKTKREISEHEKVIKEHTNKIKVLEAGAKAAEIDVKKEVSEPAVKFRLTQNAPKVKPAC